MANRKQDVVVKLLSDKGIQLWADTASDVFKDIKDIEGVEYVQVRSIMPIFISIDPRYSAVDIAKEIKQLLSSEVPKAFLK